MTIQHANDAGLLGVTILSPTVVWDVVIPGISQQTVITVAFRQGPGPTKIMTTGSVQLRLHLKKDGPADWWRVEITEVSSGVDVTPSYLCTSPIRKFASWQRARRAALLSLHVAVGNYLWKETNKDTYTV